MHVGVIVNPHSRANARDAGHLARVKEVAAGWAMVCVPPSLSALPEALKTLAEHDVRTIVVDGGDGSIHYAINAAIAQWGLDEVRRRFVFIPGRRGTINFVAAALGSRRSTLDILTAMRDGAADAVQTRAVSMLRIRSLNVSGEGASEFERYAWAAAIAGYGANFFDPWDRNAHLPVALRMLNGLGCIIGSLSARTILDALHVAHPQALRRMESRYLEPFVGQVWVDGVPFCAPDGREPCSYGLLHAGTIPVNLGGWLHVFDDTSPTQFIAHVGNLGLRGLPKVWMQGMRGQPLHAATLFDGPVGVLRIQPRDGHTLHPALDGEVYRHLGALEVTAGGCVRLGWLPDEPRISRYCQ